MYIIFRLIPALAGSVLTPLCYLVLQELGFGVATGALAGFMILFGNIGFKYIQHFLQSATVRFVVIIKQLLPSIIFVFYFSRVFIFDSFDNIMVYLSARKS